MLIKGVNDMNKHVNKRVQSVSPDQCLESPEVLSTHPNP